MEDGTTWTSDEWAAWYASQGGVASAVAKVEANPSPPLTPPAQAAGAAMPWMTGATQSSRPAASSVAASSASGLDASAAHRSLRSLSTLSKRVSQKSMSMKVDSTNGIDLKDNVVEAKIESDSVHDEELYQIQLKIAEEVKLALRKLAGDSVDANHNVGHGHAAIDTHTFVDCEQIDDHDSYNCGRLTLILLLTN